MGAAVAAVAAVAVVATTWGGCASGGSPLSGDEVSYGAIWRHMGVTGNMTAVLL